MNTGADLYSACIKNIVSNGISTEFELSRVFHGFLCDGYCKFIYPGHSLISFFIHMNVPFPREGLFMTIPKIRNERRLVILKMFQK